MPNNPDVSTLDIYPQMAVVMGGFFRNFHQFFQARKKILHQINQNMCLRIFPTLWSTVFLRYAVKANLMASKKISKTIILIFYHLL